MGEVIQFLYGEDGMEGTAIESQRMDFLRYTPKRFAAAFAYDLDRAAWAPDWLDPGELEALRADLDARQALDAELAQLAEDQRTLQREVMRGGEAACNLPVNLKRLIENAQRKFACRPYRPGSTGGWSLVCVEDGGVEARQGLVGGIHQRPVQHEAVGGHTCDVSCVAFSNTVPARALLFPGRHTPACLWTGATLPTHPPQKA